MSPLGVGSNQVDCRRSMIVSPFPQARDELPHAALPMLHHHLSRLDLWLRTEPDAPSWSDHRIVEQRDVRPGHIQQVRRSDLRTVDEYAATFAALLEAGYGWINLSALGVDGSTMVVCVERPQEASGVPPGRTCVNLSGPAFGSNGRPVWSIGEWIALLD